MTKEELNVVKDLTKMIRREEQRLINLNDWIQRITHELSGLPIEQSYQKSKIEELTIQKIDCESKINELKAKRAEATANLVKSIDETIENNQEKAVVVERYGFGQCFKKIAEKLHMTERNVYFYHRKGLRTLFSVL